MTPEQFKSWRVSQGFSQKQAAEALGKCKSTIEKWEGGVHGIPAIVDLACAASDAQLRPVTR